MGSGFQGGIRAFRGGKISLAKFVDEHREAVEYDLITKTGYELDDVGSVLSWGALNSFVKRLDPDSKTALELEPELAQWATVSKTNAILADIFDLLSVINANLASIGSGKKAKKPEKYPRPKKNKKDKIFTSAMPMNEMRKWIEERRRKHNGRND